MGCGCTLEIYLSINVLNPGLWELQVARSVPSCGPLGRIATP
jgi:hypothetical protein